MSDSNVDSKKKEFKCTKCGMVFKDQVHFERHIKVHKPKKGGFMQKWYWEN